MARARYHIWQTTDQIQGYDDIAGEKLARYTKLLETATLDVKSIRDAEQYAREKYGDKDILVEFAGRVPGG